MNSPSMNIAGMNTANVSNNSNNMPANSNQTMSSGIVSVNNNSHLNAQPPSLPRVGNNTDIRQIIDRAIASKGSTTNQTNQPQINNRQYMAQTNHVAPFTNNKLQDFVKRRTQMKMSHHPMPNQVMQQIPTPISQNQYNMFNNEMNGVMSNSQMNTMQNQQNGMGYGYPPPSYQMDNSNNQMFNNANGFFGQNQKGKMLQDMMGMNNQRQMNGMYNMHQNMNQQQQQQMFNMNNKAPPRYNNQLNANMMNQAAMMNMNSNINNSSRLRHFQPESTNIALSGMNNQLGMRNMTQINRFPPALSRNMLQGNNTLPGNQYNNNFANQNQNFNNMGNNFSNMGNNSMTPEQQIMRERLARLQQQQQLMNQQQTQQQQQQTPKSNMNFQTMMNSDNNNKMQQMMQQTKLPPGMQQLQQQQQLSLIHI